MKRYIFALLFLTVGTLHAQTLTGTVIGVHDGDTLKVRPDCACKIESIRLNGIDAPEVGTKNHSENFQPYSVEAQETLSAYTLNARVDVEWVKRDKYDRLVGTIFVSGQNINLRMIEKGYAWYFVKYKYDVPKELRAVYAAAEKTSRQAHIGLWADPKPIAPGSWRKGVRN